MCMIIYKPAGVELPSLEAFKEIANRNPHGIGFMYPLDGKVCIYKMRMEAETVYELLKSLDVHEDNWCSKPLVVHFRMATHGDKSDANCHPFPITDDDELLGARYCMTDIGLAHNGVVYLLGHDDRNRSDTYCMVKNYLSKFDWDTFDRAYKIIDEEILKSDRMIVMNGNGDIITWGRWNEDKGCKYSCHFNSNDIGKNAWKAFGHGYYDGYGWGEDGYWNEEWKQAVKEAENVGTAITSYTGKSKTPVINMNGVCNMCRQKCNKVSHYDYESEMLFCPDCWDHFRSASRTGYSDIPEDPEIELEVDDLVTEIELRKSNGRYECDYCLDYYLPEDMAIAMYRGTNANNSESIAICKECAVRYEFNAIEYASDRKIYDIRYGKNFSETAIGDRP